MCLCNFFLFEASVNNQQMVNSQQKVNNQQKSNDSYRSYLGNSYAISQGLDLSNGERLDFLQLQL